MAVYPWLRVDTEERLWEELEQRQARQQAAVRSATFSQALNAAGLSDAYPWLEAGVVQSLTLAGQGVGSPTAQMVADMSARVGLDDGAFGEPAANVPDNQFDSLWDGISTNVGRGLLNLLRGTVAVLSAPFEEVFERVGPSIEGADLATEPRFRGELGEGFLAEFLETPGDIASSLSKLTRGEFWDEFWTNLTTKAAPSTLALTISDIADPNRSPALFGYDKEQGQGLIANYERRQQYRNRITIPGVSPTADDPYANTATVGRAIARTVTEPGTEPYKVLSGVFDFAANLVPVDLGLGKVAKGVQVAIGLGSKADIIAAGGRVGLLPGIKRKVDLDAAVDGFLSSRAGRRMVDWFTGETDFLRIWERTGRNARIARDLVEADTPDKVVRVFQDNLGTTLREVPTAGPVGRGAGAVAGAVAGRRPGADYGAVFGPGAVVRRSTANLRFTHDMPARSINPFNIDDAAVQVHDLIRNLGGGDDVASRYLKRIGDLEDGDTNDLYRIVVDDLYAEMMASLINRGPTPLSRPMSILEARKLTRAWAEDVDGSRAYFIDAAGQNADLHPARNIIDGVVHDMKPVAHLLSERLSGAIPLPDVQGIKRAASFYNRVWDIPGVKDSVALADFILGTTWKSLQLVTRLAYPIRVVGEEQVRLAGVGFSSMFRHPIDYLSWAVGSPNNGRLATLLKRTPGLDEQGMRSAMGDIFTEMDEFKAAMSRGSSVYAGGQALPAHILSGRFVRIDKNHSRYYDGAATELQQLAADPIAQKIAGGLKPGEARALGLAPDDPNAASLDVIKEWFWVGQGQRLRKTLAEDPNWRPLVEGTAERTARQHSDDYVDSVADRLNIKTGQHPDLLDLVATGKLGDVEALGRGVKFGNRLKPDAVVRAADRQNYGRIVSIDGDNAQVHFVSPTGAEATVSLPLSDLTPLSRKPRGVNALRVGADRKLAKALEAYEDSLPEWVKVEDVVADSSRAGAAIAVWNKTVDRLFSGLMSTPTNALSRSVHFKQAYWASIEELMGYADAPTQAKLIEAAREAGLSESRQLDLARIATRVEGSKLTSIDDVDVIAKARALESTRDTLYDLTKRNQFFDSFRLVFPFGEAWKEIFTAWTRIIGQNPAMLRRFQQTIQGGLGPGFGELTSEYLGTGSLPGQGFFHENDHGDLVFNYPGSELASRFLLEEGAQLAFTGELAGLNLMSATITPGLGPTVQVPAAAFTKIFNYDLPEAVHNIVFPFGEPPVEEGFGTLLADVYLPAWMDKWETAMGDPDSHRMLGNTVMDVMRALVRSGEYNTNSQEEIDRLYETAVTRARLLFWIRGAAQSTAPTGPGVQWSSEDVQGNLVPVQWMTDEFYRLAQEEYGGDYDRAADEFIRRFGTDNLLALQGKTRSLVPRPLEAEGAAWIEAHPELEGRYNLTIGFYAPDPVGGEFDYDAYLETINEGTRQALTPREMVALSNSYKGRIAYEHLKSQVAGRTDAQATIWLAQAKQRLAEQYPGYNGYIPLKDLPDEQDFIAEFERALADPELADNPAIQGIRLYMEARQAAQAVVDEHSSRLNNSKGFTSSKSTRFLRDWLRAAAEEIGGQHPGFVPAWEHVFQRELIEE